MIRPHQVEAFLAPLPVGRLPGVGKVMEKRLEERAIATVADLRARGGTELERLFGRWGRRLHELSMGIDENPVQPERPTLQISSEDTFEHDLPLDELAPHIERLAAKTWESYGRELARDPGRVARTVVLKLKTADFRILTRSLTPTERPDSLEQLTRIACDLRARVPLPDDTRYRLVGVGLSGFADRDDDAIQTQLFTRDAETTDL